jgi:hypothetical protein
VKRRSGLAQGAAVDGSVSQPDPRPMLADLEEAPASSSRARGSLQWRPSLISKTLLSLLVEFSSDQHGAEIAIGDLKNSNPLELRSA